MKCEKCGRENKDSAKICEGCGDRLTAKCSACGSDNLPQARFCEQCGAAMGGVPKEKSAPATQPSVAMSPPKVNATAVAPESAMAAAPVSPLPTAQIPAQPIQPAPQPTPHTPVSPVPATSPAPVPQPGGKGSVGAVVIVMAIGVIGAGVYFAMQPSSAPAPSTVTAPVAPAPAAATKLAEPVPAQLPIAPATPPVTAAPGDGGTPASSTNQAATHLQAMIDGSKANNETTIMAAVDTIKQQPVPPKGDRKIARAANDAGLAALKNNAFDDAIAKLGEAVKADLSDQEIVNNLGYALMMAGKTAEAKAAFQDALTLAPTRSSAWANLAVVLAKDGRADDGFAAYMLAYRFSQNQQKTREFVTKQSQEDSDPKVRELAARVLQAIGTQ